jgi:hypothetical protein
VSVYDKVHLFSYRNYDECTGEFSLTEEIAKNFLKFNITLIEDKNRYLVMFKKQILTIDGLEITKDERTFLSQEHKNNNHLVLLKETVENLFLPVKYIEDLFLYTQSLDAEIVFKDCKCSKYENCKPRSVLHISENKCLEYSSKVKHF